MSFSEKENHLVTFHNVVSKAQIDYLCLRKADIGICRDCKVNPSDNLTTQHKLLVIDLKIKRKRVKGTLYNRSRIKRGGLTPTRAWEVGEKLLVTEAWGIVGM